MVRPGFSRSRPSCGRFATLLAIVSCIWLPQHVQSQKAWLVLEVESSRDAVRPAVSVSDVEQALRARGLPVLDSQHAAELFEHTHSRSPVSVSQAELDRLDALTQQLSEQLSAEDLVGVQASLGALAALAPDLSDQLNRDLQRARRRFHNCLVAAQLFERQQQARVAQAQLTACARESPGFEPELGSGAPEETKQFVERARAQIHALPVASLRIEADRLRAGARCFARVNGIDRGQVPVTVAELHTAQVRVQLECGGRQGRIYDVALAASASALHIDPSLDAALVTRGELLLSYSDGASADAGRLKHGALLARVVEAGQCLQLVAGKLRRLDLHSGKESSSAAVGGAAELASALDFVLSNGALGEPAARSIAPAAEVSTPHATSELPVESGRAPPGRPLRTLGWISAGLTVAAATTAIVAWRVHEAHVDNFNTRAECVGQIGDASACRSELQQANTASTVLTVAAVTGGAGLIATGVFFVLDANRSRARERSALGCGPGPGVVGLDCRVQF